MGTTSDRNLLFGIVALQMDFLTREQLVAGMQAWVNEKQTPLGELLVRLGALPAEQRAVLEPLVDAHVRKHDDDPQQSLAALDSSGPILAALRPLGDDDVNRSLATLAPPRSQDSTPSDPYATTAPDPYATQVTSQGDNLDVRLGKSSGDASRFRIIRPHAEGGLGSVYVAKDLELDRDVALKEIQLDKAGNLDNRNRFTLEAEITGGLEHPGIVPVYGLGTYADGRPYYAMKFIRGDSLKDAIDAFHKGVGKTEDVGARNLRMRKLLQRFIDVCEAIDYAHTRGVLHRDLKPGNIMLGRHGETLVVDWGLAKALGKSSSLGSSGAKERESSVLPLINTEHDPNATAGSKEPTVDEAFDRPLQPRSTGDVSEATMEGSILGTPSFMSPEQAQGRIDLLGPASDIFGLGATLYELLVGRPPYQAKTLHEVLALARQGKFVAPRSVNKSIPKPLDAICVRAMAPHIEERYATARALADDLERYLADEPVTAKRDTLVERVGRLVRRHRGAFLAGTAALILLTVGSIGATVVINAAKEKESAALAQETIAKNEAIEAKSKETLAKNDALASKSAAELAAANEKQRADETAAVLNFVETKIFAAARPVGQEGGLGHDVKLADALNAAVPYVEGAFQDQPLIEARLRNTLGLSFHYLGQAELAIGQFKKARNTFEAKLGPDHPDTLNCMNNLALGYSATGKLDLALPLYEETLKLRKAKLGPDHPDTLNSMSNLAVGYRETGKLDLALPLYEETLKLRKAKLGPDHPDTLTSMNNLAFGYRATGKLDLALPLYEETLKLRKAKLGPDHPDTLNSMNNLATGYYATGKLNLALQLWEETLKLMKAKLGPDHPNTLTSMNNLASCYDSVGKLDLALPLHEETLKLMKAKLGPDHPNTLTSMSSLASDYNSVGKLDLALALYEETLKLMKAKLGPDHPNTLTSMNNLASCYDSVGKLDLALPLYEETLKLRKAKLGPDHPDTLTSMNNLATGYYATGKLNLALALYEETLKLMKAKLGPDHPDTLNCMNNLALGYRATGRLNLALQLWEETLKLRKAKLGPDHPNTLTSMSSLASGYNSVGKLDLALPLYEETLKLRKAKLGPDHPDTLNSMNNLATGYYATGKLNLALQLWEEMLKLTKAKLGPEHPDTLTSMNNLAVTYAEMKQGEDATRVFQEYMDLIRKKSAPDDPRFAARLSDAAYWLFTCDQFNKAEMMSRESYAIFNKIVPDVWFTFNWQAMLGRALLGQKKYVEASPLLLAGYAGMKERQATIPQEALPMMTGALDALIALAKAQEKPDDVKKWEAEKLELETAIASQEENPKSNSKATEPQPTVEIPTAEMPTRSPNEAEPATGIAP